MKIKNLEKKPTYGEEKNTSVKMEVLQQLINEFNKKDIPVEIVNSINMDVEEINKFSGSNKETLALLKKKQGAILKQLEKELNLVTLNHNRNMWMVLGMSAFGLPIGVAFGLSMGNIGLLGIGLPIGMGIGVMVGIKLDNKAKETGKQLDVELK